MKILNLLKRISNWLNNLGGLKGEDYEWDIEL
jgi:hypothetical protein